MNPFFLLVVAVAVSMLVIPLAWRLAPRLGLVDMPDPRKVHTIPVPRVGGWGIALGALLPLVLSYRLDPLLQSFVMANLVLLAFGVWDDARQINHWAKFVGQFIAVAIIVYYGDLYVSRLPLFEGMVLDPTIGKPFTMFALVGMINAMNHSDGLDGLAGGESMLTLIGLVILGYIADDMLLAGIGLATIGGILGFLRYNSHPARVFMGDGGSQVLGLTLGFLAVYLTQRAGTAMSAALPVLLLGVPIADILAVLYQRITGGMNWFRATRNHLHHRLLDLGFTHYETVVIIYSLHAALVVSAILFRYALDSTVIAVSLVAIGGLYAALITAERRHWHIAVPGARVSPLGIFISRLQLDSVIARASLVILSALVPAFTLLASLWVSRVPRDFALVSGGLALVLAAGLALRSAVGSVLVRATIYVTCIFPTYLALHFPGPGESSARIVATVAIAMLATAIAIQIRFSADNRFSTTPTDYLIVFGLLTMMVFGMIEVESRAAVDLVIYSTVLLYACEVVISRITRRVHLLHASTLVTLVILMTRGLQHG